MLPLSRPVPRPSLGWWRGLTSAQGQEDIAGQVRDVMTEATVTDSTTDTLRSAAERMWRQQTGPLLVMENGRLTGILPERDLLRAVALGADPAGSVSVEHEFGQLVRERRLARIEHGDLD